MPVTREQMQRLRSALWTDRSSFDSTWQELADYLLPRRARFWASDRNKGDKRTSKIIDSTPRFALRTLGSGMHAGLTSPARPWFVLSTPDPTLAERPAVKAWLFDVTERMRAVFARTNVYQSLSTLYEDLGGFGTAAIGILPDSRDLFRTYVYPVGSYAIELDARGMPTTWVRDFEMSVGQAVESFVWKGPGYPKTELNWDVVSAAVKNLWDRGNTSSPVPVTWVVRANEDFDPRRVVSKFKRFASVHFETGGDSRTVLRESGYDSFPVMVPRWSATEGDSYGTDCPGMMAIGDIKALQLMQRKKSRAIEKQVDPTLQGPPELKGSALTMVPGGVNFVRDTERGLRPVHEVTLDIADLVMDIRDHQQRVREAFFADLFLMLAMSDNQAQPITAREVEERHEEKLLALGPVLEHTSDELLNPLIDRVFGMMAAAGLIPEPPEEIQGVELKVEYISVLAEAQKLTGVAALDRFMGTIGQMATAQQGILNKIDFNKVVDIYRDTLGVDPRIVRSDEDADAIGAAQARQQQAMVEAENAQKLAAAAKNAATAPMGNNSVLDAITGGPVAPPSPVPGQ